MSKILLSGYYGFNNLGDEALLQGLIHELKDKHRLTILSAQPQQSRAVHKQRAQHRYWALLPALLQHDSLISGGGSLLQDKSSRRSLQYYLGLIRLAKYLGKKVIVYGQSIGPLSQWGKQQLCQVLQDVAIAVRDEASQKLLASWGIKAARCADTALLLEPPPIRKPKATTLLKETILLIPRAGYPALSHSLIAFAQNYQASNPRVSYAIMPFQPHEDSSEVRRLRTALPHASYLEPSSPQHALEHFGQAHYILSGRLHGAILAALAERPCVAFAYDPKVTAFCQEAAAPSLPVSVSSSDIQAALTQATQGQEERLKALQQLKKRAHEGIDWLEAQLGSLGSSTSSS